MHRTSSLLVLPLTTEGVKAMTVGGVRTITSASRSLPTPNCGPLLSPGATTGLA